MILIALLSEAPILNSWELLIMFFFSIITYINVDYLKISTECKRFNESSRWIELHVSISCMLKLK